MRRLFVPPEFHKPSGIEITGRKFHHAHNVLRLKKNDRVLVFDGEGREYECDIKESEKDYMTAVPLREHQSGYELATDLVLYQCALKGEKLDRAFRMAVELGASGIALVESMRSRPALNLDGDKTLRYRRIIESAAEQSNRMVIPEFKGAMTFHEAVEDAKKLSENFLFWENAGFNRDITTTLSSGDFPDGIGIFVGPEGGFEESEIEAAVSAGVKITSLGKRRLRAETASAAAVSLAAYFLEDPARL
ncbi:MAG: 16S rRNA (uracil(1498)-N(3))-methyltransferase [Chloroflexi bacterium]|nr:16S rRNA (uracil(1498)-N(3))-methyltransferase [Chloroflexota bacterium]